ncbi:hypothetical protein BH09VER1_BH09VER1_40080 [soil metagenome]
MWEQMDFLSAAPPKPEAKAADPKKLVIEEAAVEEPVAEEAVVEEAVVEKAVVEEPVVEVPVIEEPVIEEAVAEELVVDLEPEVEEKLAKDTPLTKGEYETLAEFRWALRLCLRQSEIAAAKHGLSAQQHQALLAIEGYPGREWLSIRELADRLQVRHHTTVELVDRLEGGGLVKRFRREEDRRVVGVKLLKAGRDLLNKLVATHRRELSVISPLLLAALKEPPEEMEPAE